MNINRTTHRRWLAGALAGAAILAGATTASATPSTIVDLSLSSGTDSGSIALQWTAPDNGFGSPVTRYSIRYRFGSPIVTNADWESATPVADVPGPVSPGFTQNLVIEDLSPGGIYAFAIVSYDASETASAISNSPVGQPTSTCSRQPEDGGSIQSSSLLPAAIDTGKVVITTMSVTIAAPGIQTGGKVALKVPEYWPWPSTATADQNMIGYTAVSTTATATLAMSFDREMIVLTVTAGQLTAGTEVNFHYTTQRCDIRPDWRYRLYTQYGPCGVLTETAHSRTVPTVAGEVHRIDFETNWLSVVRNQITPIRIGGRDECQNPTSVPGSTNVVVSAVVYSTVSYTYVTDPLVLLSTSPTLSPASQSISVALSPANNPTTFYFKTSAPAVYRDASLQISNNFFRTPYWFSQLRPEVYETGIASSSVDTGVYNPSQKTVSFSPDNDGVNDQVFINFILPQTGTWDVMVSSNDFATVCRRINGGWSAALAQRVAWDGMMDNPGGTMAPPGLYKFRVNFGGGGIVDTSLSATVTTSGIEGFVLDGQSNPVPYAWVNVFGSNPRNTQTDATGYFRAYGLKAGEYRVQFGKTGYATKERTVSITSGVMVLTPTTLDKQAILRLVFTRPVSPVMPELYGGVNANTIDWKYNAWGNVHFSAGKAVADAGDHWNVELTSHTALTLTPGKQYRVRAQIPTLSADEIQVTLNAGDDVFQVVNLVPMGSISGVVGVPVGSNINGISVSVEAGIDANQDGVFDTQDASQRYWGNAWLESGKSTGTYTIYGVKAGTYTLVASAPGFRRLTRSVFVPQGQQVQADFGTLQTGGVVTGTMTVTGDSTVLDSRDGSNDGFFRVWVNANSQALRSWSSTEVRLAENATTTSSTFTLTGLEDGTYEIWTNIDGFELVPPGRRTVTVSGGSGTLGLTFQPFTGSLSGTITLPGANSDYGNVQIVLRSNGYGSQNSYTITPPGNTYSVTNLGTGYYSLSARYSTTGAVVERNLQIVNGLPFVANLDLSGDTFDISGRVTSSARAPYNDLAYILANSSPTTVIDRADQMTDTLSANRVVAERLGRQDDDHSPNTAATGIRYDSRTMIVTTYDSEGNFTIPNLPPGSYRVFTNGELDNDTMNGAEVAEASMIIRVLTADVTGQLLNITDGYSVSGVIRVADGTEPQGRQLSMTLKNSQGNEVARREFILSSSETDFQIDRVPSGDYILSVNDENWPKSFTAKDQRVEVKGGAVTGLTVDLLRPALIRGRLRMKQTGVLVTSRNYGQLLPSNLNIWAQANPWFSGGSYSTSDPIIDSENYFNIAANAGNYDVVIRVEQGLSPEEIAKGKKQLVPQRVSGIRVSAGQTYDLGIVELIEGDSIKGTVRNKSNVPIPNIRVIAYPSGDQRYDFDPLSAYTDELGQFAIQGVDAVKLRYYDVVASPRARSGDDRFIDLSGTHYGEVRRTRVDAAAGAALNFILEPALGRVRGRVVSSTGDILEVPFDKEEAKLGAHIIMNRQGDIPQGNPLGNIEVETDPDGTFEVPGLLAGTYTLWAMANNHASGIVRNISVGASTVDIGTVTVNPGYTMSGGLTRSDGSAPGESDVDTLVAVSAGFQELVIGQTTVNAAGSITGYSISGFQAGTTYSILSFNKGNEITVLAEGVTLTGDTLRDLVLAPRAPSILTTATKLPDGTVTVQYDFTGALRNNQDDLDANGIADDSDPTAIITASDADGTITYPEDWISSDRKRARIVYTPAAGERSFTLRVQATFESTNLATGVNHTRDQNFTYYLGIGDVKAEFFSNASGGTVEIGNSMFAAQPGTFGTDAEDEVEVVFRAADTANDFDVAAANPRLSRAMAVAARLGLKAYPPEMASAIHKVGTADVDPFSSFYDIFLPVGVSHFFPDGREAQLCLEYEDDVADPYALNVYYYNSTTDEYLLENENKLVDPDNQRICVSLGHASVFTVLASSAAVIAGAGYTGELAVMNFPNPFDLNSKTVTLQNPGSASATQAVEGTMIKVSVPGNIAGALEIEIFSVSGERVRTIRDNVPAGGAHYYVPWDGRNDAGSKVASGTYVARMTIGGGNEKFFKMAVLK